jgi:hypothetical protein
MEPSGRNRWQPVASLAAPRTAETGENRCRGKLVGRTRHALPAPSRTAAGRAGVGRGVVRQPRPLRRAARYQGFFPVGLEHPDELAEVIVGLATLRREAGRAATEPYDIVAALPPGVDVTPYDAAGAAWWLVEFPAEAVSIDQVRGVLRDGPASSS